jgi:D-lactate dehydrogenase
VRKLVSEELVPEWTPPMPPPAPPLPRTEREGAAAVYFPACINRIFGPSRRASAGPTLPESLVEVSRRAGLPVWIPPDAAGHCCATPWTSKGFAQGRELMAKRLADGMWRWTDGGELPLVIDATSCAHGIREDAGEALGDAAREQLAKIEVLDSIAWAHDRLLPNLEVRHPVGRATIHPTCASAHLGLGPRLEALARALARDVHVPLVATCCGFAGDRGFLHPELTDAATRTEASELDGRPFDAHLSANRTCEIGLEQATGRPYESVVQLLERATRT